MTPCSVHQIFGYTSTLSVLNSELNSTVSNAVERQDLVRVSFRYSLEFTVTGWKF